MANGAIGKIVGGTVSWCGGALWFKERDNGESDASYLMRNWASFSEMSGDHIVEQHVHNLDVANWFIGLRRYRPWALAAARAARPATSSISSAWI